jgi:creatinine amidohydrolase/Fe(II)-dependent formamide hydrolase-like protein
MMQSRYDMTRMTSPEIDAAISSGTTTAIIVLGAQEQHGPHLPMATDSIWGEYLADLVAQRIGGALIAPVFSVGFSPEHMEFPGTISLSAETWGAVVDDYISSLEHHGFKRIVLICSHGGNFFPLIEQLPALKDRHPATNIVAYTDLLGEVAAAAEVAARFGVTPSESGAHGGEWETSMMMVVEAETVHAERQEPGFLGDLGEVLDQINAEGIQTVAPNGILGDPANASAEHGRAYLDRIADLIADFVNSGGTAKASSA